MWYGLQLPAPLSSFLDYTCFMHRTRPTLHTFRGRLRPGAFTFPFGRPSAMQGLLLSASRSRDCAQTERRTRPRLQRGRERLRPRAWKRTSRLHEGAVPRGLDSPHRGFFVTAHGAARDWRASAQGQPTRAAGRGVCVGGLLGACCPPPATSDPPPRLCHCARWPLERAWARPVFSQMACCSRLGAGCCTGQASVAWMESLDWGGGPLGALPEAGVAGLGGGVMDRRGPFRGLERRG